MTTRFSKLIKEFGIDDKFTKRVNKPDSFNKIKDNVPLVANYNMMADLLFMPTAKFGFKYLFVIVDLANDKFDMEQIKDKEPSTILKAMEKVFKRGILKEPEYTLKTDGGNEFKGVFHKYLYDESILHKVALPNRHSSLANVESLNRQLGKLFNLFMNKEEKRTNKQFTNWTQFIPIIRTKLNEIREKELPKNINSYEYPTPNDTIKSKNKDTYEIIQPKFKVGQYVFRYLDQPRNALNKKQNTSQHREGDILWDNVPREIIQVYTYAGDPLYRYKLSGINDATFTDKQLMKAPNH